MKSPLETNICQSSPEVAWRVGGFTFIELLMTVAVLAVLITVAVPSLMFLVRDQRVKTVAGDVYASIVFARSEALKRNQLVKVCSANATLDGCGNTTNWAASGWIVFLDINDDDYPNAVSDILRKQDAIPDITLTGTGNRVSYQRDGRLKTALDNEFRLYSPVTTDTITKMRCISIDLSGRPNTKVDADGNIANGC